MFTLPKQMVLLHGSLGIALIKCYCFILSLCLYVAVLFDIRLFIRIQLRICAFRDCLNDYNGIIIVTRV